MTQQGHCERITLIQQKRENLLQDVYQALQKSHFILFVH